MRTMDEYYKEGLTEDFKQAQSIADNIHLNLFHNKRNGIVLLVLAMLLAKAMTRSKNEKVEEAGFDYVLGFARNFLKQFREMEKNRTVQ